MDDVDVIVPDTLQGLHTTGYAIIQLVVGIMERPAANAHYVDEIFERAEELAQMLEDADLVGDGNEVVALARFAQPVGTGEALALAARAGLQDLIVSLFDKED